MGHTLQYYDLVLIGIAASLAVGVGLGLVTPLAISISVPTLALIAIAIIGHALFVRGPVEELDDLTDEVAIEEIPGVPAVAQVLD